MSFDQAKLDELTGTDSIYPWRKLLGECKSFKEMAQTAVHLCSTSIACTKKAIEEYILEQALNFKGILFAIDLTKNNPDMRSKLTESYGLSREQMEDIQKIIDTRGGVFVVKDSQWTGMVEIDREDTCI